MKKILNYPFKFLRRLYDWTLHFSKSKHSNYALFGISFMESSFFPIPPDVLLIPLVVAEPKKWWWKGLICTAGSVTGSFLGYAIGYLFYETVGYAIVNFYNLHNAVDALGKLFSANAFLVAFTSGFTPIPYKAITIAAGMFKVPLLVLFVAAVLGRGGRFFVVAGAIRLFGAKIQYTIEKYFNILSIIFLVVLIGGFFLLKYFIR